jgi:hypothetical protein
MKKLSTALFIGSVIFTLFYFFHSPSEISLESEEHIDESKTIEKSEKKSSVSKNQVEKTKLSHPAKERVVATHSLPQQKEKIEKGKIVKSEELEVSWEKYFGEEEYFLGKDRFRLSDSLRAIPSDDYKSGEIIYEMNGFKIVQIDQASLQVETDNSARVMFNQSTKRLAILTGKVLLTMKNSLTEQEIDQKYKLEIVDTISHLGIVIGIVSGDSDIFEVDSLLKESDDFKSYEIEILEGSLREK